MGTVGGEFGYPPLVDSANLEKQFGSSGEKRLPGATVSWHFQFVPPISDGKTYGSYQRGSTGLSFSHVTTSGRKSTDSLDWAGTHKESCSALLTADHSRGEAFWLWGFITGGLYVLIFRDGQVPRIVTGRPTTALGKAEEGQTDCDLSP